jgi:hypothetical protein
MRANEACANAAKSLHTCMAGSKGAVKASKSSVSHIHLFSRFGKRKGDGAGKDRQPMMGGLGDRSRDWAGRTVVYMKGRETIREDRDTDGREQESREGIDTLGTTLSRLDWTSRKE